MTDLATQDAYGVLTEPTTLEIRRVLPGPVERVWAYLTESDLRRQWLAAGDMEMTVGAPFELVWRNDELTTPPGQRPPGMPEENRMQSEILELDPPRKITFAWKGGGKASFELRPMGNDVLLTVTHTRIMERPNRLKVGAGWHMHLDLLEARLKGSETAPFWDGWNQLQQEYDRRLPE